MLVEDIDNYDLSQSCSEDEAELPQPKISRTDKESAAAAKQEETNLQGTPNREESGSEGRRRPEINEGYIYGFVLPFSCKVNNTASNDEYYVVKIGKTRADQLGRRLKEHHTEFSKATGVPIFDEDTVRILSKSSQDATPHVSIIKTLQERRELSKTVFLISYIKDGLRAAENGAGSCIGVAPFNYEPTFKTVFDVSKRVTTTEWFVARKDVIESIQASFWFSDDLSSFDTADAFLEKLRELNKRKYDVVTISLETLTNQIYEYKVKVPKFA